MKEDFLHFVWHSARFQTDGLKTCDGKKLVIIDRGKPHTDGGPDFTNAKIKVDGQLWAGQVEIHVNSAEWFQHKHHLDPLYDGTILHVCMDCSTSIYRTNGTPIPCLELKGRIPPNLINQYHSLMENSQPIPCSSNGGNIPEHIKKSTLIEMFEKRWLERINQLHQEAELLNGDWNALLHKMLFRAFGLRINKEPFQQLGTLVPYSLIQRYRENEMYLEALLFGCSGFLLGLNPSNVYEQTLVREFQFLKHKHRLSEMPVHQWKFLRLRPANFPTIRIAQLSAFIGKVRMDELITLCEAEKLKEAIKLIRSPDTSIYWNTHYRFGQKSKKKVKSIGPDLGVLILTNAILPWLSAKKSWKAEDAWLTVATSIMNQLPAEKNKVIRLYKDLNFEVNSASDSQACMHLYKYFCSFKRCLDCPTGQYLMK